MDKPILASASPFFGQVQAHSGFSVHARAGHSGWVGGIPPNFPPRGKLNK